jgi:subtilisin family serine protease
MYTLPSDLPEDICYIPPVIVHPFVFTELESVPWHIADRKLQTFWPISDGGKDVKVGVIDTGIDANHAEIKHAFEKAVDFTGSSRGARDVQGHGTHVASSIVGKQVGGAPNARLYVYKALGDEGWGQSNWIAQAVLAAIADGVDIINMSLGSDSPSSTIYNALKKAHAAGIIIFAATGNNSSRRNSYPADFNDVCMAVAAIDRNKNRASFSNAGQGTDISDYGVQVIGARAGGGLIAMSGTSMATPVCASMAANRISFQKKYGLPTLKVNDWYAEFQTFCDDLGSRGNDPFYGAGQINPEKAFGVAPKKPKPDPEPEPKPDPKPDPEPGPTPAFEQIGRIIKRDSDGAIFVANNNGLTVAL